MDARESPLPGLQRRSSRERLREALFEDSLNRLKKRGLSGDRAREVAEEVATRVVERTQMPEFDSGDELARSVQAVCRSLGEGKSYYDVIGEMPYLVTGRIGRMVAAAGRVRPQVDSELAQAARMATALERLSGSLAVLFAGAALAVLGVWYALLIGVVVSVGTELYVQIGMPRKARQIAARYRVTRWSGVVALLAILPSAYSWLDGVTYPFLRGLGLALFCFLVVAGVPGATLALLVGIRERRWRSGLERELARDEADETDETDETTVD